MVMKRIEIKLIMTMSDSDFEANIAIPARINKRTPKGQIEYELELSEGEGQVKAETVVITDV